MRKLLIAGMAAGLLLVLWTAPALAQDPPDCVFTETWYPTGSTSTSGFANPENVAGEPDGEVASIGWGPSGWVAIEFDAVEVQTTTNIAVYWQGWTGNYTTISLDAQLDGEWIQVYSSSYQSAEFLRWDGPPLEDFDNYIGQILTGIRFNMSGNLAVNVDAFRVVNVDICQVPPDPGLINECTPLSITSNLTNTVLLRDGVITTGLVTEAGDWFELEPQTTTGDCVVRLHSSNDFDGPPAEQLFIDILDSDDNILVEDFLAVDDWWWESDPFTCDDVIKLDVTAGLWKINELEVCQGVGCSTLTNPAFSTPTEWQLGMSASINNGAATLPWTLFGQNVWAGNIQQTVSLEENTTYNAVISITEVTGSSILNVSLGSDTEYLTVSGPGQQTATFTTGDDAAALIYKLQNGGEAGSIKVDFTCLYPADAEQSCATVPNGNFASQDYWGFSNDAAINGGKLTLPLFGGVQQPLSGLSPGITYTAVITVTGPVTNIATLRLDLGDQDELMPIATTGGFSVTFTTPETLTTDLSFSIWNISSTDQPVEIDFTCLYPTDSTQPPGPDGDCIAPINGSFSSTANWQWLRGATLAQLTARLPADDNGLVLSTDTYSFTTLADGEYLLAGFDSVALSDQGGGVSFRVGSLFNEVIGNFSNYNTWYRFELDLSTLAETTDNNVALVNPGDTLTGTTASNIQVDNVCIFLAYRPPNLPAPLDPNAIDPVDLGFNYGSCDDVDGIFAYFGVNIRGYRAIYSGLAEPESWWDWLVSGVWVIMATYVCIFMAAFTVLVNLIEYLINNGLNIFNWVYRFLTDGATWAAAWAAWVRLSTMELPEVITWFQNWVHWWWATVKNLTIDGLWVYLTNWGYWLGTSSLNVATWAWDTLTTILAFLASNLFSVNGLRRIANVLIAAWNVFIAGLGVALSWVLEDFVYIWNNAVLPVLQAVWNWLPFGGSGSDWMLWDLAFLVIDLFWLLVRWVWYYVFELFMIPVNFYRAFILGVGSDSFGYLLSCEAQNFWCSMLAGLQLTNQAAGHSVMYPAVIVGIIVATIVIFWRDIWALFSIRIQ